jgi:hypothetical protein
MFPDLDMKSIPIALDEWAPGTVGELSSVFLALSSAEAMHELFRNSGCFAMSEFTHLTGLVGLDKPEVPSGSPTNPLDVAAAFTEDRSTLTVAIVNPSESEVSISVGFEGVTLRSNGMLYRIAGSGLYPPNAPGQPPEIDIERREVPEVPGMLAISKLSISLYEWPVQQ